MTSRGISPVVGIVCLLAVTAGLAAVVGATVSLDPPSKPAVASFEADADPAGELRVTHTGGDPIDPDALGIRVQIDGEPLSEQPPVPFFSASGFESAPGGAFNSATTDRWRAGETASLVIAGTNEPGIAPGSTISIRIYVGEYSVAEIDTVA